MQITFVRFDNYFCIAVIDRFGHFPDVILLAFIENVSTDGRNKLVFGNIIFGIVTKTEILSRRKYYTSGHRVHAENGRGRTLAWRKTVR